MIGFKKFFVFFFSQFEVHIGPPIWKVTEMGAGAVSHLASAVKKQRMTSA